MTHILKTEDLISVSDWEIVLLSHIISRIKDKWWKNYKEEIKKCIDKKKKISLLYLFIYI